MSWEAVSALAEAIGVIAVVVSLLYLARQTQQSRVAIEQNTKFAMRSSIEGYSHWRAIIATNPQVSELIDKANSGSELARPEEAQLTAVFAELFMAAAFSYMTVHASGNSETVDVKFVSEYLVENPYGVEAWNRFRRFMEELSPSFAIELDRALAGRIPPNNTLNSDA